MPSVAVDHELCVGSGDCARIAPSAFRVDDDLGMSVPLDGAADTPSEVLVRAAGQCPTNAIRVIDDDGAVVYESA